MDMKGTAAADQVRFQLAIPPDLVAALKTVPGVTIENVAEAPDRVQHGFLLETVAVVVTILAGVDQLAPTCKQIAEKIHSYFDKSEERQPRVKAIGERSETVIEIDLSSIAQTADTIRIVARP